MPSPTSHCRQFLQTPVSWRQMLSRCGSGLGALALASMRAEQAFGKTHFPAKAKNVIFLYMDGGPSHVDTFDHKPRLKKDDGKDPKKVIGKLAQTQFDNVGNLLASPWKFKQHGEAGHWISDLFPYLTEVADELSFVKSMTSRFSEHTSANVFLHSGSGFQGRPSMGAWFGYGLGTENENLPGFMVINGGLIPPGGLDNFGSGFLPADYQASVLRPTDNPLANVTPEQDAASQRRELDLIERLDQEFLNSVANEPSVEASIANFETAFRMQTSVPELTDFSDESKQTLQMYGTDRKFAQTQTFARQCLIARRMVQRGVRFVELTVPKNSGDRWDQHTNLVKGHSTNCQAVDQPMAALIKDLKRIGLLDSTLIVWGGEFGRTPFAQGKNGRDHNPFGFTMWFAGGGIKPGVSVGSMDPWGYRAVEDRYEIHDLHATMLHMMGIEHTQSTFRFGGRDMRLTDVHGKLIKGIIG